MKCLAVAVICVATQALMAQAKPTASGPGSYVAVGGGFAGYQADYGRQVLAGAVAYADVHPCWWIGFEGEVRRLNLHSSEDVKETTYLAGVRVVTRRGRIRPYGKLLIGAGHINLPFSDAQGTFLAYAAGGGVEYRIDDWWTVRAADIEYQRWPQFAYGELHPYGISVGVSLRLNDVHRTPRRSGSPRH